MKEARECVREVQEFITTPNLLMLGASHVEKVLKGIITKHMKAREAKFVQALDDSTSLLESLRGLDCNENGMIDEQIRDNHQALKEEKRKKQESCSKK